MQTSKCGRLGNRKGLTSKWSELTRAGLAVQVRSVQEIFVLASDARQPFSKDGSSESPIVFELLVQGGPDRPTFFRDALTPVQIRAQQLLGIVTDSSSIWPEGEHSNGGNGVVRKSGPRMFFRHKSAVGRTARPGGGVLVR